MEKIVRGDGCCGRYNGVMDSNADSPDPKSWGLIILRAKELDAEAFDALVDAYAGRLCGYFRRQLGRSCDAEDLVQEVFVRVVRMISAYEDDGRFEAWLFRIAVNLARDRMRENRRRPGILELNAARSATDECISEAPGERLEGVMHRDEQRLKLEEALERLPAAEREVVLLRHYGQLRFEEIAVMMNTPLGTALARAHRGLGKLREWMGAS